MTPTYWQQATQTLSATCPILAHLIHSHPNSSLKIRPDPLQNLIRAIIGQQLSTKAANTLWQRLNQHTPITAQALQQQPLTTLQSLGLSQRKSQYIHAVCQYFLHNNITSAHYFEQKSDTEIINELTSLYGIGKWSAQMFLIFTLARPNILPSADLGLQRALSQNYQHERLTPSQIEKRYIPLFSPWCSVATWYLWQSLNE